MIVSPPLYLFVFAFSFYIFSKQIYPFSFSPRSFHPFAPLPSPSTDVRHKCPQDLGFAHESGYGLRLTLRAADSGALVAAAIAWAVATVAARRARRRLAVLLLSIPQPSRAGPSQVIAPGDARRGNLGQKFDCLGEDEHTHKRTHLQNTYTPK